LQASWQRSQQSSSRLQGPNLALRHFPKKTATFDPATLPDQEIGRRFSIKAEDLPPPKSGPVVSSRSLTLPYEGQRPRAPEGFTVTAFATGLEHPRRLLVLPNGDVIVAEQKKVTSRSCVTRMAMARPNGSSAT